MHCMLVLALACLPLFTPIPLTPNENSTVSKDVCQPLMLRFTDTKHKVFLGSTLAARKMTGRFEHILLDRHELLKDIVLARYKCATVDSRGCFQSRACVATIADSIPHRCKPLPSPSSCPQWNDTLPLPLPQPRAPDAPAPYVFTSYHMTSFYHFAFEALACLLLFLETLPSVPKDLVILSYPCPAFVHKWFSTLSIPKVHQILQENRTYDVFNAVTTHCPPNPDRTSPQIFALRRRFAAARRTLAPILPNATGIVILRRHGRRSVDNLDALVTALQQRFEEVPVTVLFLEGMPLLMVQAVLESARVIVSPHGAQLGHIALVEYPNVLELVPEKWQKPYFKILSCNYIRILMMGKTYFDTITAPIPSVEYAVSVLLNLTNDEAAMKNCSVRHQWRSD